MAWVMGTGCSFQQRACSTMVQVLGSVPCSSIELEELPGSCSFWFFRSTCGEGFSIST